MKQIYPPTSLSHAIPKIKTVGLQQQVRYLLTTDALRRQALQATVKLSSLRKSTPATSRPLKSGLQEAEPRWAQLGQLRLRFSDQGPLAFATKEAQTVWS